MDGQPLWSPSRERILESRLHAFTRFVRDAWRVDLPDYAALHRFSIDAPERFWPALWDFSGLVGDRGQRVIDDPGRMPGARFFPDARINFAENLLRRRDASTAIVFRGEGRVRRSVTHAELDADVSRCAQALRAAGVGPGDRVAAYLPNLPEAIVGVLATAGLGAIWSSASPDFGVQGVLDRFGQIAPKVLIGADGYHYGGRTHDCLAKLREIVPRLPGLALTLVVPYVSEAPSLDGLGDAALWPDLLARHPPRELAFERFPFNHPLYILYSSGTTGVPKCILHGAGGTLIQHVKEHQLHCDVRPGDRVFHFTTCGWMMWNWLVTALASDASLVLYDGSPFHPDGRVLFDLADETGLTLFGTSAKFLASVEKAGLAPEDTHDLGSLRTITSTGSPLAPESFDFVYARVKRDVHLASISGGTDIVSCFVGGNPTGPVWRGEIQGLALGMDVAVYDDEGRAVRGEKGSWCAAGRSPRCRSASGTTRTDARYRAAYFERFPGVWWHGDYAEITDHDGVVIYGRSDAVLNPGGVRIGTAEIYRQVEQLDEVVESLVVGQQHDRDERVVLFVRLRAGLTLDAALTAKIRDQIRRNTTPRHVPARVVQVADIPRTKSGKIVELAVRDVIHGREVKNREALANPEALELFMHCPELES